MSRFNLWEKIDTDTEVEKEISDEVPEGEEGEEAVEDEVESEEEDTLYDLMANFILALPEDIIPEDLQAAYEAVTERLGDEYMTDEEGSGEDSEASEGDSENDESEDDDEEKEIKEAKELVNPYEKGTKEYDLFEKFKKSKGAAKIAFVSKRDANGKQDIEGTVATKFLELLGESKEMTGPQLANEIENVVKKYFPESYVRSKFEQGLGNNQGLVSLKFAIGKDKSEWVNGIIHNDPAHASILVWGFDKDGNQKDNITMSSTTACYSNYKTGVKSKCGWRDIKKGGTVSKVLKALDNYFAQLKEVADSDGGGKTVKEAKETTPKNIELKLKKDKEWDEWVIQVYVDGKYSEEKSARVAAESDKDKETKAEAKKEAESTMADMKSRYAKSKKFVIKEDVEVPEFKQNIWKRTTAFDRL